MRSQAAPPGYNPNVGSWQSGPNGTFWQPGYSGWTGGPGGALGTPDQTPNGDPIIPGVNAPDPYQTAGATGGFGGF